MAGDWIKLQCCTPDKPEVFGIADHLGIEPEHALGGLVKLWIWVDQQSRSGNDLSVTKKTLERITGVSDIAEAMSKVGWLQIDNGIMSIPNFDRHNGKSAKSRALAAKRAERFRNDSSVIDALPEKRREEKSKKKVIKEKPSYTDDFLEAWSSFSDKSGSKLRAFEAWQTLDDEDRDAVRKITPKYLRWLQATDTKKAHMSSWLNQRRFENSFAVEGGEDVELEEMSADEIMRIKDEYSDNGPF